MILTRRQFGQGAAVLATALAAGARPVRAADDTLAIGYSAEITSTDPHYHALQPNNMIGQHLFGYLVLQDERQRLHPGLALSWTPVEPAVWEFKLRPGVTFSDGSPFDAEDVLASLKRVPWVPNSPSPFTAYIASIAEAKIVDPLTIRFLTHGPAPLLPNDISAIAIINRKMVEAPTADFNSGKAVIGTGPFRFVDFVPGDRVTMVRNDGYWGGKPPWSKVTFRIMTNAAGRISALLAGDVQVGDAVPTPDIGRLKTAPGLDIVQAVSSRLIYFHLDRQTHAPPYITAKDGSPLRDNPLNDLRVRQALTKAIDRKAMVSRVMEGVGTPASQFLPDGFFGTSTELKVEPFDLEGARRLLHEAGFPDGFAMTIHGPNDRYINDAKIAQAAAQMFNRVGIQTKVDTMPWATYAVRASKPEFSVFLLGWGSPTGETSSCLRPLVQTYDKAKGAGTANRGRYSNPELDKVIGQAMGTVDDTERGKLLAKASEIAIRDVAVIPMHYEVSTWALRKGLSMAGRADQETLAMDIHPSA